MGHLFKIRRLGLRPLETPCFLGQNSLIALPSTPLNKEVVTSLSYLSRLAATGLFAEGPDQNGPLEQDWGQNDPLCFCIRPRPAWAFGARLETEQRYPIAIPLVLPKAQIILGIWSKTTERTTLECSDPLCFCRRAAQTSMGFWINTGDRTTLYNSVATPLFLPKARLGIWSKTRDRTALQCSDPFLFAQAPTKPGNRSRTTL